MIVKLKPLIKCRLGFFYFKRYHLAFKGTWSALSKSVNTQYIKNLNDFFEQWSVDGKSDVNIEKHPWVAELKLKWFLI